MFIVSPHANISTATKRKKAVLGAILLRLKRLDEFEDAAANRIVLHFLRKHRVSRMKRKAIANRFFRQRRSWLRFKNSLSPSHFRRYFRMSKDCFELLCEKIIENVGESEFKSEEFLKERMTEGNRSSNLMKAHLATTGGYICGEIKLALVLRLLAGGSYLDLAILFETSSSYAFPIFHEVIEKWILSDYLVKINGQDYCSDDDAMAAVALQFARSSNGIINGCIGAIDGWIVKIRRPRISDGIMNPGSFFSRIFVKKQHSEPQFIVDCWFHDVFNSRSPLGFSMS